MTEKKTLIGKVCNDFLEMPWDKILAGLITGLLIYIGAARLFIIQDKVYDTNIKIEKLKNDILNTNKEIEKALYSRIDSILLELNHLEMRMNKNIRTEFKTSYRIIDDIKDKINELDIRISIIETKLLSSHIQKMKLDNTIDSLISVLTNKNEHCLALPNNKENKSI
tara:strand:- start:9366 stop:9866 length:501 start_codon:yes stop_codon:yes gene_type:complete